MRSPIERFFEYVEFTQSCWFWTGARTGNGYGSFTVRKGYHVPAHRWAYSSLMAEIPAGLVIDHLCRQPLCVNPDHLEAVTNRENLRRGSRARGGTNRQRTFALKDKCRRGHLYAEAGVFIRKNGRGYETRKCKQCARETQRQWVAKQRGGDTITPAA